MYAIEWGYKMEKIFKIIIRGISYGVTSLMISYLGIYFVAGNSAFEQEMIKLTDINILATQLLMSAVIGILILCFEKVANYYIFKLNGCKDIDANVSVKKTTKYTIFMTTVLFIIMLVIGKILELFTDSIGPMFTIICVLGLVICGTINMIKCSMEEFLINKKIKEKNVE